MSEAKVGWAQRIVLKLIRRHTVEHGELKDVDDLRCAVTDQVGAQDLAGLFLHQHDQEDLGQPS